MLLFSGRSSCSSQLCTHSCGLLSAAADAAGEDVSGLAKPELRLS